MQSLDHHPYYLPEWQHFNLFYITEIAQWSPYKQNDWSTGPKNLCKVEQLPLTEEFGKHGWATPQAS